MTDPLMYPNPKKRKIAVLLASSTANSSSNERYNLPVVSSSYAQMENE